MQCEALPEASTHNAVICTRPAVIMEVFSMTHVRLEVPVPGGELPRRLLVQRAGDSPRRNGKRIQKKQGGWEVNEGRRLAHA